MPAPTAGESGWKPGARRTSIHSLGSSSSLVAGRYSTARRSSFPPASTHFLVVAVEILGEAGVDDGADVGLVHAQAEGGGRHHEVEAIVPPGIQQYPAARGRRLAVEAADAAEAFTGQAAEPLLRL